MLFFNCDPRIIISSEINVFLSFNPLSGSKPVGISSEKIVTLSFFLHKLFKNLIFKLNSGFKLPLEEIPIIASRIIMLSLFSLISLVNNFLSNSLTFMFSFFEKIKFLFD